jgi:exopolysaccharide production protein ExoQ
MNEKSDIRNTDRIIVFFAFLLVNLRASIFVHLFPDTSVLLGPAWVEIALWFFLFLTMVYSLRQNNQFTNYLLVWRRNRFIALFILLALGSVFWSIDFIATVFRVLELVFATLVGAYIGMRYRPSQLLKFLFWFGAILLMLSIALVFAAPKAGTMYWAPFDGAWRGLFWHRNHLSSMAALLSVVFLCRTILAFEKRNVAGSLDVIFYALSLIVLFFAESATGYLLFIMLNFLVLSIWLWLKIYPRLRAGHYISILGVFGAGLILIFSNLDTVFGLFNRNTTLTGRVGLWDYLLNDVVSKRLWWGHGFGAFWTLGSMREQVRLGIGWPSQPLIADNGFLDILVHLGIAGFGLLLLLVLVMSLRSVRYALTRKTLEGFFPVLFMVYAIVANIPFSLFAETEVFIWFLMIAVLFMTTPSVSLAKKWADESYMDQTSTGTTV